MTRQDRTRHATTRHKGDDKNKIRQDKNKIRQDNNRDQSINYTQRTKGLELLPKERTTK